MMEIGRMVWPSARLGEVVARVSQVEADGFAAAWVPQIFGWDALTVLALAGERTSSIRLGTAVLPTHPTHPLLLAASALTTQAAVGGRLQLGIGVSHRFIVEDVWGLSFERPVQWARDYLAALVPTLNGGETHVDGVRLRAELPRPLDTFGTPSPPVLLAALGPAMLRLAGEHADGTVTLMTGVRTVAEHVVPTIRVAAAAAGRPAPRIVVGLPTCVTPDVDAARRRCREEFAAYSNTPSYRAMLDREGAADPADVALIGSRSDVLDRLDGLREAGATEYLAWIFGSEGEQVETVSCLQDYARR
ncbi:TIGR03564 family F420-dependent LLM class oxidoreductase [Rhodococcus hoagii]|uniref:TIGR03564 family F420-dependent LLM class oxidoreductase n=3 Tax=Prescottella TaxID=2979332 RepID=A0AAE4ZG30_RHOHA|nr:TIGR03564 family F420-dependent LLM class oxidoreductase [Prescottella equi]MBM4475233.1 TIGR03564 family F420-dependent LLM class oxidoreductase [Prescottella equi]MBM9835258.1 TIGR03564 family F420-dependent LLM class oxidoreductase [Prescottella equi]NKR48740.1 TIGR03564 family F420-dependent LLM class oxidoreductase [Prescottella equi]NKR60192.1 TIGR03564 family F420-dependent LLM class oxidoreductase [Prescottella equi]